MTMGESGMTAGYSGRNARYFLVNPVEEGNAREAAGRCDLLLAGAGMLCAIGLRVSDPERADQVRERHPVEFVDQAGDVSLVGIQPTSYFRHREVRLQEGAAFDDEPLEIGVESAWHGRTVVPAKVGNFYNKN